MLSVLGEVHFWTLREEVQISNNDFGAFRYLDKKTSEDSFFFEGKKSYAEKRGQVWAPQNKRPVRLKDNLRELEEHLYQQRVVLCQWHDCDHLQLMFSSGLIVNIFVNIFTGDLVSISFDKFLVGKLLSDYLADVVLTKSHLICSYNDNQLTLVYFAKPAIKRNNAKSLSSLEPRICTVDLAGPVGRRLEKRLACNVSGDMVAIWWLCSPNEVYPWSPVVKDQDRANVLIYGISGSRAELLCHHRSEFDLISIVFSKVHSNVIHSVEQKVTRNGDVTVESCSYEISRGSMQRTSVTSIALPTHVCCHAFSPAQDKLLLGCIDGSVVLYDDGCGVSVVAKAMFIPSLMSWHPDGGVVMLANERCQLQLLDAALATIRQQLMCEDVMSSPVLDISSYFRNQPTLSLLQWNKKPDTLHYGEKYAITDCLLLLLFERGPLTAITLVGGGGLSKDIHGARGLSFDSLVAQYLSINQIDTAVNLLLTLNWDINGSVSLSCLQRIVNHLFRRPLTADAEEQLQTALGSFHMPTRPLCPATVAEFKAPVRDLTRRFFHLLLRYQLFEKAFRLAIDLLEYDLFMDIHFSAKQAGEPDIAAAAYSKAKDLESNSSASGSSFSGSSPSLCSRSSCSECSETASAESSEENENELQDDLNCKDNKHRKRPVGRSCDANNIQDITPFTSHPPLPIVHKNLRPSPGVEMLNRLADDNFQPYPPFFRSANADGLSKTGGTDIKHSNPALVTKEYDKPLSTFSPADKPKVKFSETVTQITLPDRLHTLPEEDEERHVFTSMPAKSYGPKTNNNSDLIAASFSQSMDLYCSPRFSHSANSVGIPISSSQPYLSKRLSGKDSLRAHQEFSMIDHEHLNQPAHVAESTSATSSFFPSKPKQQPYDDFSVFFHPSVSTFPPPSSFQNHPISSKSSVSQKVIEEMNEKFESNLNVNPNQGTGVSEQVDFLGTEELLTLLPGSRKPVASCTSETLPSKKEIHKAQSPENTTYYFNYPGVLHDLSEEEENNGSIKIVHFGVV